MVLYARSDIIRANPTNHPTHFHERPLIDPKDPDKGYVPFWGIDCPPCEAALDDDNLWSKSRYRIPLTPDEIEEQAEAQAAAEAAMRRQQVLLAQAAVGDIRAAGQNPEGPAPVISTGEDSVSTSTTDEGATGGADYSALTREALKDVARERNLTVGGTKDDLIARLVEYDRG